MSIAEIERFAADLRSNEALRSEAEKAATSTSHATPADGAAAFAASRGYAFTAAEATSYFKARLLSDAELDGVAGGMDKGQPGTATMRYNAIASTSDASKLTTQAQSTQSSHQTMDQKVSNQIDANNALRSRWDAMLVNL